MAVMAREAFSIDDLKAEGLGTDVYFMWLRGAKFYFMSFRPASIKEL